MSAAINDLGEATMERMMDGTNGGMETTAPMRDLGPTDGGGTPARRASRPKARKKTRSKPKAKARTAKKARAKSRTKARGRKAGGRKSAKKKSGRRR